MLSQERRASGPQDRDMMGETKKKRKGKIGIHAPIGFPVVCSLQMAFELILPIHSTSKTDRPHSTYKLNVQTTNTCI